MPHDPKNMITCFLLIIVGMGLVSMCWSLVQLKVSMAVDQLLAAIRSKYLQRSLEDASLEGVGSEEAEQEVDQLISTEQHWLASLMGASEQTKLVSQWQSMARLRNRGCQVSVLARGQTTSARFADGQLHRRVRRAVRLRGAGQGGADSRVFRGQGAAGRRAVAFRAARQGGWSTEPLPAARGRRRREGSAAPHLASPQRLPGNRAPFAWS